VGLWKKIHVAELLGVHKYIDNLVREKPKG
jgi:hypothetical protein